jgi:hypothetical protein
MKKTLLAAIAVGALAAGGAAFAQSTYTLPNGYTVYEDQNGNQMHVDQYGRMMQPNTYGHMAQPNTATHGILGYDAWGRPVYGATQENYGNNRARDRVRNRDRDGDGVANNRDRYPNDRRYW